MICSLWHITSISALIPSCSLWIDVCLIMMLISVIQSHYLLYPLSLVKCTEFASVWENTLHKSCCYYYLTWSCPCICLANILWSQFSNWHLDLFLCMGVFLSMFFKKGGEFRFCDIVPHTLPGHIKICFKSFSLNLAGKFSLFSSLH